MNIQDTHVWAETFLGILPKASTAFVAKLASLNTEWRAAVSKEMQTRLYSKLHRYLGFVDQDGTVHLSAPLGADTDSFTITDTHLNLRHLLRATIAMSQWTADDDPLSPLSPLSPPFPSVHDIFKPEMDDIILTRNTALFLLANVWACLKLPKCWGTSCDTEDMPYNVVDVALLTEWEEKPKQKAVHIFWMFLFLHFVIFRWTPEVAVELDTVKLLMVIIEVSSYLRYQLRDDTTPLPPGLRKQITDFLLADPVELEDQGMCAEGTLGQSDDAD